MKRIAVLLLAFVFGLALALPAFADVIFEPEDDFYKKHREECSYVNRNYYADGEGGSVTVWRSPENRKEVASAANGEVFNVSFVWNGGAEGTWGVVAYDREDWRKSGWVLMSDLSLKYDSISFREEFGGEIRETGEELKLGDYPKLQSWPYPCAAAPDGCFDWSGDSGWSAPEEPLVFNNVYEDPSGLRWGYVGYFYGDRDFWVCLSAPDAEDPWAALSADRPADPGEVSARDTAPEPEPAPTTEPAPAAVVPSPQTSENGILLPVGLTAGAVVLAGAMLALFRRKE